MEEEYYKRIDDNFLKGDYVDGEVLQHTDLNELEDVVKLGINANYEDIQKLRDGTYLIGNSERLDGATLSKYDTETLQASDTKVPTSMQVKEYVDTEISHIDLGGYYTKREVDGIVEIYDSDGNGIVDNAEKVNSHTVGIDVPSNALFTDTLLDFCTYYEDVPQSSPINLNTLPSGLYYFKNSWTVCGDNWDIIDDFVLLFDWIDEPLDSTYSKSRRTFFYNMGNKTIYYNEDNDRYHVHEDPFVFRDDTSSFVEFTDYAMNNTSGVIKTSSRYKTRTDSNGLILCDTVTSNNIESLDSSAFVSKGTLGNYLSNYKYVRNTDYAGSSTGGVVKLISDYALTSNGFGVLYTEEKNYSQYTSGSDNMFVGKGTLENVITGKELTNKTYVDTALSGKQNTLTFDDTPTENSNNPVKSGGIYTSQEAQDTQIETLQGENDRLTNEVTQLQEEVDKCKLIENALPKVTGTGTFVTLDNTVEAGMEVSLSGNTSQETTTGKNILPTLSFPNSTNNGITLTKNSNNEIVLNGLATAQANHNTDYLEIPNGLSQVTLSGGTSNVSFAILTYTSDKTYISTGRDSGSGITYSIPSNAVYYVENVRIASGVTLNNYVLKAQMESGSSASSYEPPIGITPNPQFPQTIHSVTGDNSINVEGTQLFDKDNATSGRYDDTGTFVNDTSWKTNIIQVQPNTAYTFSGITTSNNAVKQCEFDENMNFIRTQIHFTNGTITTANNCKYINATCRDNAQMDTFMVNVGNTANPYKPYTKDTYPLTLGDLEVNGIDDYEDVFIKATNETGLESGKWYLKKNIGKIVLDGTNKTFSAQMTTSTTGEYRYRIDNTGCINALSGSTLVKSYCNRLIAKTSNNTYSKIQGVANNDNSNQLIVFIDDIKTYTLTQANTWLETNNLIIYYILATPNYILLNDTLQTQLNNIEKAISYNYQTNISQTNDDLPMIISASALLDLNTVISNLTNAVIELGGGE